MNEYKHACLCILKDMSYAGLVCIGITYVHFERVELYQNRFKFFISYEI